MEGGKEKGRGERRKEVRKEGRKARRNRGERRNVWRKGRGGGEQRKGRTEEGKRGEVGGNKEEGKEKRGGQKTGMCFPGLPVVTLMLLITGTRGCKQRAGKPFPPGNNDSAPSISSLIPVSHFSLHHWSYALQ